MKRTLIPLAGMALAVVWIIWIITHVANTWKTGGILAIGKDIFWAVGFVWIASLGSKIEDGIYEFYETVKRIEAYLKRIANKIDPEGDMEAWAKRMGLAKPAVETIYEELTGKEMKKQDKHSEDK